MSVGFLELAENVVIELFKYLCCVFFVVIGPEGHLTWSVKTLHCKTLFGLLMIN